MKRTQTGGLLAIALGVACLLLLVGIVGVLVSRGSDPVVAAAPPDRHPPRPTVPLAPPPAPAAPAEQAYVVKRVLDIRGPIRIGDYAWDDAGVPAGPVIITVDIAAGTLSIFRAGYEIGAAAILYGADEKPTPTGVFPILMKDAHHVSRRYNDAPMPYTLRLTGDGVSIHGSDMGPGRATHGCIGVPVAFARHLFEQTRVGDRVIVTNGKTLRQGEAIARL